MKGSIKDPRVGGLIISQKGGRLTLIKSTQRIYQFTTSLLVLPASVRNRFEGIMRQFLWSGSCDDNHLLVKCSLVTQSREAGGLRIKSLAIMSKAVLRNWIWRGGNESGCFWKEVLKWIMERKEAIGVLKRLEEVVVVSLMGYGDGNSVCSFGMTNGVGKKLSK